MGKGGLVSYDSGDFFSLIFQIKGSIFDNVAPKLIISVVLSVVAAGLHSQGMFRKDNDPERKSGDIPTIGFSLCGTAIAFLLVFRSNMSYNRFWEGRGHLGNLMAQGRDLARQIAFSVLDDGGQMQSDKDPDFQKQIDAMEQRYGMTPFDGEYDVSHGIQSEYLKMKGVRRLQMVRTLIMFWRLLVHHARDEMDDKKVEQLWAVSADKADPNKRKALATYHQEVLIKRFKRRPLIAVAMFTQYLRYEYQAGNITTMEFESMNQNVHQLIQGFNGVDKIHNVQIPFPYAQMLLVFLGLYVFAAPFMFVTMFKWFTFIPSVVLCLAFFGINEIALEIEDPFGEDENDLPVEQMGDALKDDCEMYLEVAGIPSANIKLYWDQIAKSKQRWKVLQQKQISRQAEVKMEAEQQELHAAPDVMVGRSKDGWGVLSLGDRNMPLQPPQTPESPYVANGAYPGPTSKQP